MRTLIGGLALTSASVFTAVLLVSYCGALFTKQCSCFFYQKWQCPGYRDISGFKFNHQNQTQKLPQGTSWL